MSCRSRGCVPNALLTGVGQSAHAGDSAKGDQSNRPRHIQPDPGLPHDFTKYL